LRQINKKKITTTGRKAHHSAAVLKVRERKAKPERPRIGVSSKEFKLEFLLQ
jgi:hypothetical protein